MADIVEEVKRREEREGISERAMSRRLHMSNTHWRGMKAGSRGIQLHFLQEVVAAYPDLLIEAQAILLAAYHARNSDAG